MLENLFEGLSRLGDLKGAPSTLEDLARDYEELSERDLDSPLGDKALFERTNFNDLVEGILQNKIDGLRREMEVLYDLESKYPGSEGYSIISEAYFRDADGMRVKDPVTDTARRVDFVIVKDGRVVDMIEVTSLTADKTEQCAKERRIRESGGNYVRTPEGTLLEIPDNVETNIERRK